MRFLWLALVPLLCAATIEYTESERISTDIDYCLISIVSGSGDLLQAPKRVPASGPAGGILRSIRVNPNRAAKDSGMAANVSCCDTRGLCSEAEQDTHDFVDMLPEEPGISFDGTTLTYVEPSFFVSDRSAIPNLKSCSFEFRDDNSALIQKFTYPASAPTGGATRSVTPVINSRSRALATMLAGRCLTTLGVQGPERLVSLMGVF